MALFGGFKAFGAKVGQKVEQEILHSNAPIGFKDMGKIYSKARREALDERMDTINSNIMKNGGKAEFERGQNGDYGSLERARSLFYRNDGSLSYKRIAGAAFGGVVAANTVGRIATGGGLYRDSDGNFDIIGIPFI